MRHVRMHTGWLSHVLGRGAQMQTALAWTSARGSTRRSMQMRPARQACSEPGALTACMGVHEMERLQPHVDQVTAWEVRGRSHQV